MTNYITAQGVQQFSISIARTSLTGTATINAVGAGAFILYGGSNGAQAGGVDSENYAYLTLTNSTTITATRQQQGGTTSTLVITGSIVDADTSNLVKSVQYGTVTIPSGSASGTATISAVTNNNTAVHFIGLQAVDTGFSVNDFPVLSLSGTTVTAATQGNAVQNVIVGFEVIEFQGAALNQAVQNVPVSFSTGTSKTAAITSVNTGNAIMLYAGSYGGTGNLNTLKLRGILTNSTTVTVNSNTTVGAASAYNCSVVEFVSGVLNQAVQRSTTTLTGVTSNTSTITSVNTAYAGLNWLGNTYSAANTFVDRAEGAGALTSGTVVTVTKATATANITGSWEVFEFPAFSGGPVTDNLTAAQGTITLSGNAATLSASRNTSAAKGTLTVTGNAATLFVKRNLAAAKGTIGLLGNLATLSTSAVTSGADTHDGVPRRKIMLPIYERRKIEALELATEELIEEISEPAESQPVASMSLPVAALEWDNAAIEAYARETMQSIEKIQAGIEKMLDDEEMDFMEMVAGISIH